MTSSKFLVDITKGWDHLSKDLTGTVKGITGQMSYLQLCCSTGVLTSIGAQTIDRPGVNVSFAAPFVGAQGLPNRSTVEDAKYIFQIINKVRSHPQILFPKIVTEWNAMSLCLAKAKEGLDIHGKGAYSGFKCANIIIADRLNEDKRNPNFKFNCYNIVYSCNDFMGFLDSTNHEYGEALVSTGVPGAHGARVRACVFSPNVEALEEYHEEKLQRVKDHVLASMDYIEEHMPEATPTSIVVGNTLTNKW